MRLRYTKRALREIDRAIAYIAEQSPSGARNVAERFHTALHLILDHPLAGTPTGVGNSRRVYLNPYPYMAYYRIKGDEVLILRFSHTSRRPR